MKRGLQSERFGAEVAQESRHHKTRPRYFLVAEAHEKSVLWPVSLLQLQKQNSA